LERGKVCARKASSEEARENGCQIIRSYGGNSTHQFELRHDGE